MVEMQTNKGFWNCWVSSAVAAVVFLWTAALYAEHPGWERTPVNLRANGGSRIIAIEHPAGKGPLMRNQRGTLKGEAHRRKIKVPYATTAYQTAAGSVFAAVIDSPPIDGFVPLVAVSITDASSSEWMDYLSYPAYEVTGNYLTDYPQTNYSVGIFDTGASTTLISDDDAILTGIYDKNKVTSSMIELVGATGNAFAWVSQPLGVFIDGLSAIDSNGLLVNTSGMVGQTNTSIIVGDPVESPYTPTAIGAPVAIYLAALFRNDRLIPITYEGNDINVPDIKFYPLGDPGIPTYENKINLELRPSDAVYVGYFPCVEIPEVYECPDGDGAPQVPTTTWDFLFLTPTQSLYFLRKVHLGEGSYLSRENTRFMLDTGAQVTVIGEGIAADLHLSINNPQFTVVIKGVTGDTITAPGFYIDTLDIPAVGDWLSATNVPVIVLNVDSPEGGLLDGIIGMNLFVDLNFVFHGGGLMGLGYDPYLTFQPICGITGDIVPPGGNCRVNYLDLKELAAHWLETSSSVNWNPDVDLGPLPIRDNRIDFVDYALFAQHWLETR